MSTRCQVIVCDSHDEVWFYHHWDGYPSAMGPLLVAFLDKVRNDTLRSNAEQSCGWLVRDNPSDATCEWKASEFEPCAPRMHGDIEWLYRVNVATLTITMCHIAYEERVFRPLPLAQQVFVPLDISVE